MRSHLYFSLSVLVFLLLSWVFWLPDNILLKDACLQLYRGYILLNKELSVNSIIGPGSLILWLEALLVRLVSSVTAGKILLTLYTLGFVSGAYLLFRQLDAHISMWGMLPAFAINAMVANSDFGLLLATDVALFALSATIEYHRKHTLFSIIGLGSLNLLLYLLNFYVFLALLMAEAIIIFLDIDLYHLIIVLLLSLGIPLIWIATGGSLSHVLHPLFSKKWSGLMYWYTNTLGETKFKAQPIGVSLMLLTLLVAAVFTEFKHQARLLFSAIFLIMLAFIWPHVLLKDLVESSLLVIGGLFFAALLLNKSRIKPYIAILSVVSGGLVLYAHTIGFVKYSIEVEEYKIYSSHVPEGASIYQLQGFKKDKYMFYPGWNTWGACLAMDAKGHFFKGTPAVANNNTLIFKCKGKLYYTQPNFVEALSGKLCSMQKKKIERTAPKRHLSPRMQHLLRNPYLYRQLRIMGNIRPPHQAPCSKKLKKLEESGALKRVFQPPIKGKLRIK